MENRLRKGEKKPISFSEERKKAEQEKLIKKLKSENKEIASSLTTNKALLKKVQTDYKELKEILREKTEEEKKKLAANGSR